MRLIAVALCFALIACAAINPDYNAKKVIRSPSANRLVVSSSAFGTLCTTEIDENKKPYRPVIFTANLDGLPPEPLTVILNGLKRVEFPSDRFFALRYPAGVGEHTLYFSTPTQGPIRKTFTVVECEL
jgi:hypothetical protein